MKKDISYRTFNSVKNAFTDDQTITFEEVLGAFNRHPSISKDEVLRLFRREAVVGPEATIEGQQINYLHLIFLVEALEDWTGKTMSSGHNPWGPLDYLDDYSISIGDIADFFSTDGGKIAHIKKNLQATAED
jgi:hypothetical protein